MKSAKNIFFIFLIVIVGIALLYYALNRGEKKPETGSSKKIDSVKHPHHEITPVEMGEKPEVNPKDGSIKILEEFIKSNTKNPSSFKFLEWSEVSSEDGYWKVRCKYTGVSSFNAEVTTNAWFYIRNNKVAYSKIISKICLVLK